MTATSLKKKFISLYARQIAMISLVTLLSVFAASYVLENLLIKKALKQEADYFWTLYDNNPTHPLPNTNNLRGYLKDSDHLSINSEPIDPHHQGLENLEPGFGRVSWHEIKSLYYVSDHNNKRLYLFFLEENVHKLILLFGVLPLSFILLLFYLSSWLAYTNSKRLVSPLQQLAKRVSDYRFDAKTIQSIELNDIKVNADIEVLSLIKALEKFNTQLQEFIERERNFTRDASHELRTPVAIIKGSLDMLKRIEDTNPEKRHKYLQKIRQTAEEMDQLIATLLLLAHNGSVLQEPTAFSLPELLRQLADDIQAQYADKNITLTVDSETDYHINAPKKAVAMVFENLIENAFKYTPSGTINIQIEPNQVTITDSGIGMNEHTLSQAFTPFFRDLEAEAQGFGLGLPLVKRICESLTWHLLLNSEVDKGTTVLVTFPANQVNHLS